LPFEKISCATYFFILKTIGFMRLVVLSILFFFFTFSWLNAQSGCPGCAVNVPAGLAADTIYLPKIPSGEVGKAYDQDISFRMPKTTTPVYAIDTTTPPGLTISKIEILSLEGLPKGLTWQPNQTTFEVGTQTDGCIKICGTPSEADSFVLLVKIKATVFFLTKESTFPMRIYIAPKVSKTDGFSMTNFTDCGKATVSFKYNVPSGGKAGFTYEWDFGDSTALFKGEDPAAHIYSKPGIYIVKYKAKIDTSPTVLKNVTVLKVECVDQLGVGDPDLYVYIKDATGTRVFDSSPDVTNAVLPHTFPVGLVLGAGNYTLEVWDEDSGLKGGDDACGTVSFNVLSNGTIISGGFKAELEIEHLTEEVISQDTVIVYPNPDKPVIAAPNGLTECGAANTVQLKSNSVADNQWLLSGQPIQGAVEKTYDPVTSGFYSVLATNEFGCTALSDSVFVGIYANPQSPVYTNSFNLLAVNDSLAFPAPLYTLQWFNGSTPIPGATGYKYCTKTSGNYGVQVTNTATGCKSYYAATVAHNSAIVNCISGTNEAAYQLVGIFPNPTSDAVQIRLQNPLPTDGMLRIWDATGRFVYNAFVPAGTDSFPVDCSMLANGVFTLEVTAGGFRGLGKVVVVR